MRAVHLLVFFCVVTGSPSFARIYHNHDLNRLDGPQVDQKEDRRVSNQALLVSLENRNNGPETIYMEPIKNNLTEPDNWRSRMKLSHKKKVWKSDKKSTKRKVLRKTGDLKNALDETLVMPEKLLWKIDTSRTRSKEFEQIKKTVTSKPLTETSEAVENEYKSEADKSTQIGQNFISGFSKISTIIPASSKQEEGIDSKVQELEYYKGEPTQGQRLSGPDIKELMKKLRQKKLID